MKLNLKQILKKKNIGVLLLIAVGGAVIIISIFSAMTGELEHVADVQKATECPPLAGGRQVYNILTDANPNPRILQVVFDPHDAKEGETQIVTVKVLNKDTDTITNQNKANVTYYTDSKKETISLKMAKIEEPSNVVAEDGIDLSMADDNDLVTTWQGTWTNNDTTCSNFTASIVAANASGEHKIDATFR